MLLRWSVVAWSVVVAVLLRWSVVAWSVVAAKLPDVVGTARRPAF